MIFINLNSLSFVHLCCLANRLLFVEKILLNDILLEIYYGVFDRFWFREKIENLIVCSVLVCVNSGWICVMFSVLPL